MPTADFTARLWERTLAELPQPSQRTVSSGHFKDVVGRLMGEGRFRESFYASPEVALRDAGFHLSPVEIAVLEELGPENLIEPIRQNSTFRIVSKILQKFLYLAQHLCQTRLICWSSSILRPDVLVMGEGC
ncbi:MAG: Os1348 family NHLP clan protein [Anaerolineaceae bacterium]|nr:Os1348 family NHLP clan protein [Anaerolineaceae bacterium]